MTYKYITTLKNEGELNMLKNYESNNNEYGRVNRWVLQKSGRDMSEEANIRMVHYFQSIFLVNCKIKIRNKTIKSKKRLKEKGA